MFGHGDNLSFTSSLKSKVPELAMYLALRMIYDTFESTETFFLLRVCQKMIYSHQIYLEIHLHRVAILPIRLRISLGLFGYFVLMISHIFSRLTSILS